MTTKDITIRIICKTESELTEEESQLLNHAKDATFRSYAPYSHFSVGAAALLEDGTIVEGSNQETSSYPQSLCAERTTLFYANSRYPDKAVKFLCVAARGTDGEFIARPIPPCGGCRDVMCEMETKQGSPIKVMLYGKECIYILDKASDLLPLTFDNTYL